MCKLPLDCSQCGSRSSPGSFTKTFLSSLGEISFPESLLQQVSFYGESLVLESWHGVFVISISLRKLGGYFFHKIPLSIATFFQWLYRPADNWKPLTLEWK